MFLMMSFVFMSTWIPYAIVAFTYAMKKEETLPLLVSVSATFLAKSSTFVHPIVYFLSVKRFRQDMIDVLFHPCGRKEDDCTVMYKMSDVSVERRAETNSGCKNGDMSNESYSQEDNALLSTADTFLPSHGGKIERSKSLICQYIGDKSGFVTVHKALSLDADALMSCQ